ncbi:MAG: phage baseplate assembly protein V [Chloroflexota bacterium]
MKHSGPYIGIVVNNLDPLALGRVQVKVPTLDEDRIEWARVMAPRAGLNQGILFRPEVGDEVVVMFLEGSPDNPVVMGGLWSPGAMPPSALAGQSVIRTNSGHMVTFDDAHGAECIEITTPGGQSILLSDESDGSRIEIVGSDGTSRIVMNDDNGTITISADSGDIVLRAGGDVVIEGTNIRLSAQAQVDITGTAGTEVTSQGPSRVQGALVQLDGSVLVNGQPLP